MLRELSTNLTGTNILSPAAVLVPHGTGFDDYGVLNSTFKALHSYPFYYSDCSNLLPYVSDRTLSLLAPSWSKKGEGPIAQGALTYAMIES